MRTCPAFTINPDAGSHRVTCDPRELEAARCAGEVSLREFPYYRERYGDRASYFGTSDGAWLVTLCDGGADHVQDQVLWLGTVLASRGVPRWLLERHLEVLHAELARALPGEFRRCDPLLDAAALLRALRQARLSEADFRALGASFAARADPGWVERLPRMGEILAAAVADEADGIAGAALRVAEWAADPSAFPRAWTDAVRATLFEARVRLRSPA